LALDRRAGRVRRQREECVPELCRFFGIVIRMFHEDHATPLVHAEYGDYEVRIEIATGRILSGSMPLRGLLLVGEWLALHRAELLDDWRLAAAVQPLNRIAPLE
jgi:hypothetical protein